MDEDVTIKKASTLKRAWLLNILLLCVFGLAVAIPVELTLLPAAVKKELPLMIGDWIGKRDFDDSKERAILAPDTHIRKADYTNSEGRSINVSLVISGQDLNNSIHRPERCLEAQGHGNISRKSFVLPLSEEEKLPVSHVVSTKVYEVEDRAIRVGYQSYYWFIGHKTVTNSHYKRSFIDIMDRLTGGTAQQWAYISISFSVPPDQLDSDEPVIREFVEEIAKDISQVE